MARAFLDTNILVYADDADAGPNERRHKRSSSARWRTGMR